MPLKGRPLCLQHPDWGGKEWIMRLDYSPWDGTLFRINPPGNYRQHKQRPSASARTAREAIVSEDNIIFVNDLLLPRVAAISTYSAGARSAAHIKKKKKTAFTSACVCVRKQVYLHACVYDILCMNTYYSITERLLPACFRYGFGLLDAALMVQQAAHFNSVDLQMTCTQEVTLNPARWKENSQLYMIYLH